MITALGGGVGAAKFLSGLIKIIESEKLNIIVNTADDISIGGLRISPDIDTIIYTLSGNVDKNKKWGLEGDTFNCLNALSRFGIYGWFNLGDSDLATHLYRTHLRSLGYTYTDITSKIAKSFGLTDISILPMTDCDVETWIVTENGEMHFHIGQGDFVVTFCKVDRGDAPHAVFDVFRVEDDRIAEHWTNDEVVLADTGNRGKF